MQFIKNLFKQVLSLFLAVFILLAMFVPTNLLIVSEVFKTAFSDDEKCRINTLWFEGRGEPSIGRKAILIVLENRAKLKNTTICDEVGKKHQFSYVKNLEQFSKINYEKYKSFKEALEHDYSNEEILYYFRKDLKPIWSKKMTCDVKIQNHVFCVGKY